MLDSYRNTSSDPQRWLCFELKNTEDGVEVLLDLNSFFYSAGMLQQLSHLYDSSPLLPRKCCGRGKAGSGARQSTQKLAI